MSNRALNALKSGTVKVREFSADVLSDIKKYVEESKEVPSFVNRNKVSIALGDLIRNIEVEKDENKRGELMAQATRIEQALSGEKCIICLQNFEFKENVPVSLCPNCNYAGHRDHFSSWIRQRPTCPICKADLTSSPLILGHLIQKDDTLLFTSG